jgi:predicted enzyme related to lactoylglutathione lyase
MPGDKKAVLDAAVPILSVADLAEALDYYERVLGFQIGWKWGVSPRLASVCRDRVELNLSQSAESKPKGSQVYFQMAGVDTYYKHVTIAGARVAVPLADRPYGMRDFRIVDPSGNELSFGEASGA